MADENDAQTTETKPTPRRRPPRKSTPKSEAPSKPTAAKRASRPAASAPKKPAVTKKAAQSSDGSPRTDSARSTIDKAADKVGGKRNAGLIAGGLAVAGAAAAALLSLRGSAPKRAAARPANDTGAKAHQPDGTDSSAQMDAMIADENMVPDKPGV